MTPTEIAEVDEKLRRAEQLGYRAGRRCGQMETHDKYLPIMITLAGSTAMALLLVSLWWFGLAVSVAGVLLALGGLGLWAEFGT